MSVYKPVEIELFADALPATKFAAAAAAILKRMDRIEVEPSRSGVIMRGVWDFELDLALGLMEKSLDRKIRHGSPTVLYREGPPLLEPIMQVRLYVPEEVAGDVIADSNLRRGLIQQVGGEDSSMCRILGLVPLANIFGYFAALQRLTGGVAKIDVDFHDYQPVPPGGSGPGPDQPSAAALSARRAG